MKVLMIAPQPFFEPRGTPISVYQRLHGLSRLGHEVDLLTIHVGMEVEIPNVTIHRTPVIRFIKEVAIGPSAAKLLLDLLLFIKAVRMLLTKRYDVIHSHEEAAFYAMFLGIVFGLPHVYDMHSSLPRQLKNFNFGNLLPLVKLFELLERAVLKTCAVALTIGTDLEAYIQEIYPDINHIRIENTAIHNNLNFDEQEVRELRQQHGLEDRLVTVYTGNFERYQGFDLLFTSVCRLVGQHPELAVVMVGGKDEQIVYWQEETKRMGIEDHVIFTGIVSLTDSLHYLAAADILVTPRTEGLSVPLKIYSYLYAGKPTLATKIEAHTQILNDEVALLVEPTPDAFAAGLLRLITDPALRQEIGQNGQAMAMERFSMKAYVSKLEQAYLAAILAQPIEEIAAAIVKGHIRSAITSG